MIDARLIILAAGTSTRMGSRNKLLLPLGRRTVLERTVNAAVEAAVGDVFVVTGEYDYRSVLASYPVTTVQNPDFAEGMASSIRTGIAAEGSEPCAYGIMLGDMPFIQSTTISLLAGRAGHASIVVPQHDGTAGHPVFFGAAFRGELLALAGDAGARSIVAAHRDDVERVRTDDPGVLRDIDTEEAYRRAQREI